MIYQDFKILLKIAILFMLASACKRIDEPDLKQGNPVFYVRANIAGLGNVTKEAGNDDYYMFASHYSINNREVYRASLKKADCDSCPDYFEIEFYSKTSGSNPNIDSNIILGDYQYTGSQAQSSYKVNFINESDGLNNAIYDWSFPNSISSNIKNPEIIFNSPGLFSVDLMATAASGNCNDNITKTIFIGDNHPDCFSQIYYTRYSRDSMTFFAINNDTVSKDFIWDFGDGTFANSAIVTKKYDASNLNKTFHVKLVTNTGTCSDSSIYKISTSSDNSHCVSNFRYEVEKIPSTIQIPSVKISYTDKTGKKYSSDIGSQLPNASFKILRIEEYDRNEKNENVKKIDIQFTARLYYSSTDFIDITSEKSVIGISY